MEGDPIGNKGTEKSHLYEKYSPFFPLPDVLLDGSEGSR